MLTGHGAHIEDVGRRLKLDIITWHDFMRVLREARDQAIATGDETLDNLCHGIIEQILATPDCEVSASGNIGPAKHVPLTLT